MVLWIAAIGLVIMRWLHEKYIGGDRYRSGRQIHHHPK